MNEFINTLHLQDLVIGLVILYHDSEVEINVDGILGYQNNFNMA